MSFGDDIVADIAAGIAEVGPPHCILRRPVEKAATPWGEEESPTAAPAYTDHDITAVEEYVTIKDSSGTQIGTVKRVLTIVATGVVPGLADSIAVGVAKADATAATETIGIASVEPQSLRGRALAFKVTLKG